MGGGCAVSVHSCPFLSVLDTFPTPEIGYKTLTIVYISLLKYLTIFSAGSVIKTPTLAGRSTLCECSPDLSGRPTA
ncbi:MAG: hypothetical protein KAT54_02280 [Candidatus Marinimicrobia bacterium]|nr:hypothetical protein [Candidatus Neomarinimicrobiota bacterium]